ncbi:hypothetical protein [Nonomuraea terrae]|uniref:hypothetical protein n=1 Tax=Nonomuraea terrae TaxID=2530383 RepID=UPI001FE81D27|nr:hypothetical protein [Nonomuraea terrae]
MDVEVRQVVHGEGAGQQQAAVGLADRVYDVAVGFVVDLADDLFQEVLECDDAVDRAAFVDDEGDPRRGEPAVRRGNPRSVA